MASTKSKSWKWKDTGISVDSQVIRKLPKNPKNMNGMKKGQGQLPSGFTTGVSGGTTAAGSGGAAEGLEFASNLLALVEEASPIEDITDQQPVTSQGNQTDAQVAPVDPSNPVPIDGEDGQPAADRYVKGAHLISKSQVNATDFEELWIYRVDSSEPEQTGNILKAILAGTDIPETKTRSEDGQQSYTIWTAGNAQYLHITGLSN